MHCYVEYRNGLKTLNLSNKLFSKIHPRDGGWELCIVSENGRETVFIPENDLDGVEAIQLEQNKLISIHVNTFNDVTEKLKTINLSNNNLFEIDSGLFISLEYLEELLLNSNKIPLLRPDTFRDLVKLKNLDLGDNELVDLDPNIFEVLTALEELRLESNRIENLDPITFKNLVFLKRGLYLNNNRMKQIDSQLFRSLMQLEVLNLNNNLIKEIDRSAFFNCINLDQINISNNLLNQINDQLFQSTGVLRSKNLCSINLSNNQIKHITKDLFLSLNSLKELDLSSNKIENLEIGAFDHLKKIKTLKIDNNLIEKIDRKLFEGLNKNSKFILLTLFNNRFRNHISSYKSVINDDILPDRHLDDWKQFLNQF